MISHPYKCIFVHIPKTGGASIERIIWPNESDRTEANLWMGWVKLHYNKYMTDGLQHLAARYIKQEVGDEVFQSYYKFAVVRNPWDKAVSEFVYMKKHRRDLRRFLGINRWTSFKSYLKLISKKPHAHWMKQVDFLYDPDGHLMVDKIIRFENLEQDFRPVRAHLGLPDKTLPHINKSKRKHYASYYNAQTKHMVEDLYSEDIERFQYTFEE